LLREGQLTANKYCEDWHIAIFWLDNRFEVVIWYVTIRASSSQYEPFSFISASCSHVTHQLPIYQVAVSISCFEKANSPPTNIVKTGTLLFLAGW
jgi:hypothetical protein